MIGGAQAPPRQSRPPIPSGARELLFRLYRGARVFHATLREIFDESAYERFLSRCSLQPSPLAYAAFRREHEVTKSQRPRCC
jgi:hypothetical protein